MINQGTRVNCTVPIPVITDDINHGRVLNLMAEKAIIFAERWSFQITPNQKLFGDMNFSIGMLALVPISDL